MKPSRSSRSLRAICGVAIFLTIGLSAGSAESVPEPVLDIAASGIGALDNSKSLRKLTAGKLAPGTEENTVILSKNNSVKVPFDDQDPLFLQGPWTWMARCKFSKVATGDDGFFVAARWEGAEDRRILALIIDGKSGRGRFQVSTTGTLDTLVGVQSNSPIPEGEWVTLVGRFVPGEEIGLQIFIKADELIDSRVRSTGIPEALPEFPLPLVLGRAISGDMEFARFRAWNSALSDEEIKTALVEK